MKDLNYLNEYRIDLFGDGKLGDSHNGAFRITLKKNKSGQDMFIIASDGGGWEHVSVSTDCRCPKWGEMQEIKEMFFEDSEVVIQIHPAKDQYVNNYAYCLHLWRSIEKELPLPDSLLVGVKGMSSETMRQYLNGELQL